MIAKRCIAVTGYVALTLTMASFSRAESPPLDLTHAVILSAAMKAGPEAKAVQMLIEEVEKRSRVRWEPANTLPKDDAAVIVVGRAADVRSLTRDHKIALPENLGQGGAEGFQIGTAVDEKRPIVWVAGNDSRGVLFGVGRLLRELRLERDRVTLPANFQIATAPQTRLRGHQLGYRPKTNSYDGWNVAMWEQYIRDLVVFGCNAIELIPPRSDDDADSPHFPLPPMRMMVEMSRLADAYGLDVWVWYPALDADYGNARTVEAALKEWAEVLRVLPRLDAVFVPGGDPGHTPPRHLFALLEKQTASIRRFHPKCQMWMSPQSFSKAWMDEFFSLVNERPPWLAGIVHGPQVRMSLPELRKALPAGIPIRDYPDITHSRHCQYPVPDWDLAFALTQGREVSNPRPKAMAQIYRLSRPHTVGFITYSEGCHDDVNKCVWSALGWHEQSDIHAILREYARYFIGPKYEEPFARELAALEMNWRGPILDNAGITVSATNFLTLERGSPPAVRQNWRFQQALYRACYDSYIRVRLGYETKLESQALARLGEARTLGSLRAMDEAQAVLDKATKEPVAQDLRARVFEIGEALFQSIHAQLSVRRYQAIAVERGANLETIDLPLNNAGWLKKRFIEIRTLEAESERLAQLDAVVHRTDPGPGGFYDHLGDPRRRPHLVPGVGADNDPAFYATPFTGFSFRGLSVNREVPNAWWSHAETLYDTPLKMYYTGLDPKAHYRLRVVYGRERLGKIRLEANQHFEIHGPLSKPHEALEFDIPPAATAGGKLDLSWTQESGRGGNGRGCQVVEVFLSRKPANEK